MNDTKLRLESLEPRMVLASSVVISEFMASNQRTLADEDGEFPDWIELFNTGTTAAEMNGWFLTDDANEMNKWRIPDVTLGPSQFLVVFASNKDRVDPTKPLHTNFRLSADREYLALVEPDGVTVGFEYAPGFPSQLTDISFGLPQEFTPLSLVPSGAAATALVPTDDSLGTAWHEAGFDDSGWISGTTGIGYERSTGYEDLIGMDLESQMYSRNGTAYLRVPFEVADPSLLNSLTLRMKYDDGFVAYLNGTEVARANAPANLTWNADATSQHSDSSARVFEDFDIAAHADLLQPGGNILAIHGLNNGTSGSDFLIMPELTAVVTDTIQTDVQVYLLAPTPGEPNGVGAPGVAETPTFSRASGNYVDQATVELSVVSPSAVIRYTTDGSEPDVRARNYTGPISVSSSTMIRARAFDGDLLGSVEAAETFVILDSSVQNVDSNLPIIIVDTFGRGVGENSFTLIQANVVDVDPTTGRAAITDDLNFGGRGGLKLRGSSSLGFPKKQWAFETWDGFNEDTDTQILDFPAESDYILYAPYSDKSLMQNPLSYEWSNRIGRYAVRTRFVELYYNTSGKVGSNDYHGVYVLMEKIKRGPDRVDIAELSPSHTSEPEITGGYILKKDRLDPGDGGVSAGGHTLGFVDPKEDDITPQQRAWIKKYIDDFAAALNGPNFANPELGYAKYIDVDSFVDHHIMVEMTKNIDGYRLSTFMYLDRGGKLTMGPIWDYNLSLGNADYLQGGIPEGWYYPQLGSGDYPWYSRLFQDLNFQQRYVDRWTELRRDAFSTERLMSDIDGYVDLLSEAQVRNYDRWRILGTYVWPNFFVGQTYQQEIDFMKGWLETRLAWIDSQWLAAPGFSHTGGQIDPGFQLRMASDVQDIYYTLDGVDPRLPGGGINPNAIHVTASSNATNLLVSGAAASAIVPADDSLGLGWTQLGFDAGGWLQGTTGVGYERSFGYEDQIGLDVGNQMHNVNASAFIRVPFEVGDPGSLGSLFLKMKYDDGFVAYINGTEVARANAPVSPMWDSEATSQNPDSAALIFQEFDVSAFLPQLRAGGNVLAIHGLNAGTASSDFLILPELATDASLAAVITLDESAKVTARARRRADWSGITEATFLVGDPPPLRITEIMYHPHDPPVGGPYDDDDFEFVELQNTGNEMLSLGRYRIDEGIDFTFPDVDVAPGGVVVIVSNQEAFESRYGVLDNVIGQYAGRLNNPGDHLRLVGALDEVILDFRFDDDSYPSTDGGGHSLVIRDARAPADTWGMPASWRASDAVGGTPGVGDSTPILGDTNGDGVVNIEDLNNVRNNFGGAGLGDTNGDGVVNIEDLNNVRNNFGAGVAAAQPVAPQVVAQQPLGELRFDLANRRLRPSLVRASRGHVPSAEPLVDRALMDLLSEDLLPRTRGVRR